MEHRDCFFIIFTLLTFVVGLPVKVYQNLVKIKRTSLQLSPSFVKPWAGRLLNIHPSLLPEFPGAHAHRDAIKAGVTKSGCTVHFVDSGMDTGPIIAQQEVSVLHTDDENSLAEKVKLKEHILYPKVIDHLASGNVESP